MKNKKLKKAVLIVGILISGLLILWLSISPRLPCWWQIKLADWVPIFLGFEVAFVFSYILANKFASYERCLVTYESIVIKMQKTLTEDPAHIFRSKDMLQNIAQQKLQFYQQSILLYFKKLSNLLSLLTEYKGDLLIDAELSCIRQELDTYKFSFTDNLSNATNLREKRNSAQRSINIIDYNLDIIRLKIHDN